MRDREKGTAVDYVGHFEREAAAFEAAARRAAGSRAAPAVPSCPEWVVTDLVLHLGMVHRLVARVVSERMQQPPARGDRSWRGPAGEWASWLPPGRAPRQDPVPARLLDWFGAGAAQLAERFRAAEPGERVWTWSPDHSVGFWQRMQAIEAAVHRWRWRARGRGARPRGPAGGARSWNRVSAFGWCASCSSGAWRGRTRASGRRCWLGLPPRCGAAPGFHEVAGALAGGVATPLAGDSSFAVLHGLYWLVVVTWRPGGRC
jgi:uncharacterized protein (TIGR03083 family)